MTFLSDLTEGDHELFSVCGLHTALFATLGKPVTMQRGDDLRLRVPAVVHLGVTGSVTFGLVVGDVCLPRDR